MADEQEGNIITLLDEDGTEHEFEHIGSIEHDGSTYVALVPAFDDPEQMLDNDGDLVILKVVYDEESGEDMLAAIEDDDEFDAVSEKFEEMLDGEYEIIEEDEAEEDGPQE